MRSDYNGLIYYDDEMVKLWNGLWVHHSEFETRHPQEFVRAPVTTTVVHNIRQDSKPATPVLTMLTNVGLSTVLTREDGPAAHLFEPGIGEMVIATNFKVR